MVDKGYGIKQITDMHDDAMAWGKQQGCEGMTVAGRKGWKKVLAIKRLVRTVYNFIKGVLT